MDRSRQRAVGLDALRGLAVLLVAIRHAWAHTLGGAGITGVVIFFSLSGYLITGVLQRDLDVAGRFRGARFYAHRAFRLLPALVALLVVYVLVTVVSDPLHDPSHLSITLGLAVTYTSDLDLPAQMGLALGHLWSLAIEEQFYLVWPLVLLISRRHGLERRVVLVLLALAAVVAPVTVAVHPHHLDRLYTLPTTWSAALLVGCAARIYDAELLRWAASRAYPVFAALAGAILVAACLFPNAKERPLTYGVGGLVIGCAATVLLVGVARWSTLPTPALRPLVWLGTISYAVYLWDYPITAWLEGAAHGRLRPGDHNLSFGLAMATFALTLLAATLSWWTVELMGRRGRRIFDERTRRVTATVHAPPVADVVGRPATPALRRSS